MQTKYLALAFATVISSAAFANIQSGTISTKDAKSKDYHTLATVSLQDAIGAALAKVPGKAVEAELDSEKGFLVYEVKVIAADNTRHEITVDAGNQSILEDKVKKGLLK